MSSKTRLEWDQNLSKNHFIFLNTEINISELNQNIEILIKVRTSNRIIVS